MLAPEEVHANLRSADLKGVDQTFDFDIKSASVPGELHDMVDPTDYKRHCGQHRKRNIPGHRGLGKNGKKIYSP